MERMFSCEICYMKFDNTTVIPLVLICGHSFCTPCIATLANSSCPKCRTRISSSQTFPVNYLILSLIDEFVKAKDCTQELLSGIEDLRGKLNDSLSVTKEEISKKSVLKDNIEDDLKKLKFMEENCTEYHHKISKPVKEGSIIELMSPERYIAAEEQIKSQTKKQLLDLVKKYEKLLPSIEVPSVDKVNKSNFSLKKRKTNKDFLREIYQALKKSEKVFAFSCIDKKLKYGELTVRDNKILIYSLTLDKIPDDAKTAAFQDLKECTRNGELHTFLEIAGRNEISHLIIIKLEDSKLCPNFIKLCTGECGPSYHNKPYKRNEKRTKSYNCDCVQLPGTGPNCNFCKLSRKDLEQGTSVLYVDISEGLPADYYKNIPKRVACALKDVILTERPNDGFRIERVESSKEYEIMGRVIYPLNILDYMPPDNSSYCKILGCGIMLEL